MCGRDNERAMSEHDSSSIFLDGLGDSLLILGDGNLTFAWALSQLHPKKKILATVSLILAL